MIAIVDYGVGNLHSISGAVKTLTDDVVITSEKNALMNTDGIILPGVGAFPDASEKLFKSGLGDVIIARAKAGAPLLGVCLGMQLLFEKSYEYGEHKGLSLLKGEIAPMANDLTQKVKVPHMGWNALSIQKECALTKYIQNGDYVYYVHSFYAKGLDCLNAGSEYANLFVPGIVSSGNVFGCQFHPEKSGSVGLNILKAFLEVTENA
ncbi:MAG: imidazole glycerol phosphate synthase subunit HisH [Clostridia bacterium]|nr:imidazole glycerol phosphate synthase subunit HisH [Clostridia bacterium]